MNSNNKLILWVIETIKRFGQKNPKFFQIWQYILGFLIAVTGLPDLLKTIKVIHALPAWLEAVSNADAAFGFLGAFLMTYQSAQSKPVAVTEEGQIIKETDQQALPFTALHEVKIATKEGNNNAQQ